MREASSSAGAPNLLRFGVVLLCACLISAMAPASSETVIAAYERPFEEDDRQPPECPPPPDEGTCRVSGHAEGATGLMHGSVEITSPAGGTEPGVAGATVFTSLHSKGLHFFDWPGGPMHVRAYIQVTEAKVQRTCHSPCLPLGGTAEIRLYPGIAYVEECSGNCLHAESVTIASLRNEDLDQTDGLEPGEHVIDFEFVDRFGRDISPGVVGEFYFTAQMQADLRSTRLALLPEPIHQKTRIGTVTARLSINLTRIEIYAKNPDHGLLPIATSLPPRSTQPAQR